MVGHLKFRVFPPFALQPFIADRLRSINVVGKGKRPSCSATVAETRTPRRQKPGVLPVGVMEAGAQFTFAHMTHGVLDVGIVPLSVQIMKSCSGTLRPLEDQWQPSLEDSSEGDIFCTWWSLRKQTAQLVIGMQTRCTSERRHICLTTLSSSFLKCQPVPAVVHKSQDQKLFVCVCVFPLRSPVCQWITCRSVIPLTCCYGFTGGLHNWTAQLFDLWLNLGNCSCLCVRENVTWVYIVQRVCHAHVWVHAETRLWSTAEGNIL